MYCIQSRLTSRSINLNIQNSFTLFLNPYSFLLPFPLLFCIFFLLYFFSSKVTGDWSLSTSTPRSSPPPRSSTGHSGVVSQGNHSKPISRRKPTTNKRLGNLKGRKDTRWIVGPGKEEITW